MATLQIPTGDLSSIKQKAMEDAKKMQTSIEEDCRKAGYDLPPYMLTELIGKGSFGRVYKARSSKPDTPRLVAVKIIDIEESDSLDPKTANTYSEIMREISTLKVLRNSAARNINYIVDAIPVGQSMWMVTEYCAGGSVATLMRPTGGLQEKWIIPILREVAEALFWVHKEGIIHRDIKCANVLITESGEVQLCDFGVAGLVETKFDKRSTFTGTLHWMAPEFFDPERSYGTKVDIWAFGSLVYEIASGLPPNVAAGTMDVSRFGNYLKQHIPRLDGDIYSPQLKDLVTFCMVEDPEERPAIEQVQRHPYLFNTSYAYPTASLLKLVNAYKVWESQGGARKSLFGPGGAQMAAGYTSSTANEEWNFSSDDNIDQLPLHDSDVLAVYDVYGSNIDFPHNAAIDQTSRPTKKGRRRPPPQILALKAPLEKVFDPNTISNYEDNSRVYYAKPETTKASDLPLRDDSLHSTLRESLIDLDAGGLDGDFASFADMDTIRAADSTATTIVPLDGGDLAKPPLSDPADMKNNRRTQDWTFPAMAPASANPEVTRFPFHSDEEPAIRPPLAHHQTEPVPMLNGGNAQLKPLPAAINRNSASSLIDLDDGLPDMEPSGSFGGMAYTDSSRPSTSHSDVASLSGSEAPFEFENHTSVYAPFGRGGREPSIYVTDDTEYARWANVDHGPPPGFGGVPGLDEPRAGLPLVLGGVPDMMPGDGRGMSGRELGPPLAMGEYALHGGPAGDVDSGMRWSGNTSRLDDADDSDSVATTTSTLTNNNSNINGTNGFGPAAGAMALGGNRLRAGSHGGMPAVPQPPVEPVMLGLGSPADLKTELSRLLASLQDHLGHTVDVLEALPVRKGDPRGSLSGRSTLMLDNE